MYVNTEIRNKYIYTNIKRGGIWKPQWVVCLLGQGIPSVPTLLIFSYPSPCGSVPKEIPTSLSFLPHDETKAQYKLRVLKPSCTNSRKLAHV